MEYMERNAIRVIESAAEMHECEVAFSEGGKALSAESDEALVSLAYDTAAEIDGVTDRIERAELGGSEDATYLMQRVQDQGGYAAYVGVGTDHPGGHHTATFDVDEASIPIGVDWLSRTIQRIATEGP
jgi:aminobenzoyl-glutamate utilization protein A